MKWHLIETAPKDGTRIYLFHTEALDQGDRWCPKGAWNDVTGKWDMSHYPYSKDGRSLITGQPNLWRPISDD